MYLLPLGNKNWTHPPSPTPSPCMCTRVCVWMVLNRNWQAGHTTGMEFNCYQWPLDLGMYYTEGNRAFSCTTPWTNADALTLWSENAEAVSVLFLSTQNPRIKIPPAPCTQSISELATALLGSPIHLHKTDDSLWHLLAKPSIGRHFIMLKFLSM